MCIGGSLLSDDEKIIASKRTFILNEDGVWKDDIVPPIPENENVPFRDGVSTSSDGFWLGKWRKWPKFFTMMGKGNGKDSF